MRIPIQKIHLMKEEDTESMDDEGAILQMKTDTEGVVRKDMKEGDEEVGLHITNGTEVTIVGTRTDAGKITGAGVEAALPGTEKVVITPEVIMRIPRVHPKGEKETGTREQTGEDVEVALLGTEAVVKTINTELDVKETDTKKINTTTDTAEAIKGEDAEVLLQSLREDVGLRHQIDVEKIKGNNARETPPRSTNNRRQTETDERANLVRRFKVDHIRCCQ